MKQSLIISICFFVLLLAISSCREDFALDEPFLGALDADELLLIGDSYASGYSADGWSLQSQSSSAAAQLASQLESAGAELDFRQAALPAGNGSGQLYVIGNDTITACLDYWQMDRTSADPNWNVNVSAAGPFNDLSAPFLPLSNLADSSVGDLAYLERILNAGEEGLPYKEFLQGRVEALSPSFFMLWMGLDEVLYYAKSGGGYLDNYSTTTPPLANLIWSDVSAPMSKNEFLAEYEAILSVLLQNNDGSGCLITLPDAILFPYFTYSNAHFHKLDEQNQLIDSLFWSTAIADSCVKNSPIWIQKSTSSGIDTVLASTEDLILLSAFDKVGEVNAAGLAYGLSANYPLLNAHVLDEEEKEDCRDAISDYNAQIESLAEEFSLPLIDMSSFFDESVRNGTYYEGIKTGSDHLTGGIFGTDGIYPHPRGQAIIANRMAESLNSHFNAGIPLIQPNDLEAVLFP